jgi:hypothetical protein
MSCSHGTALRTLTDGLMKMRSRAWLAFDVAAVAVFVGIGRTVHDHGVSFGGFASTAWPFASGLVIGWLVTAACHLRGRSMTGGFVTGVSTVAVGMTLRVVSGQGIAVAFVFVALGFLGLAMLGWRLIDALSRRSHRDRAAEHWSEAAG